MGDENDLCQFASFADVSRKDLQRLAKAHGIKANGKSGEFRSFQSDEPRAYAFSHSAGPIRSLLCSRESAPPCMQKIEDSGFDAQDCSLCRLLLPVRS
eukprot:506622-Pyramimonas_sp.AAC.1